MTLMEFKSIKHGEHIFLHVSEHRINAATVIVHGPQRIVKFHDRTSGETKLFDPDAVAPAWFEQFHFRAKVTGGGA